MSDNPSDEQRWIPSNEQLPGAGMTPPEGIPGTDAGQTDWGAPQSPQGVPGQPAFYPHGGPQQSSGKAVASLVLGIIGLVMCPVIPSILALVFGYSGRSEIDNSGGRLGNRGLATAGIVLGWIGVALYGAIILLFFILALANPDSFNDSSSAIRPVFG